jgi:DoxX-like family
VGYPQQLRVLLGLAKLAGAIVLLLPRLPTLKEWAYAGFTFMVPDERVGVDARRQFTWPLREAQTGNDSFVGDRPHEAAVE